MGLCNIKFKWTLFFLLAVFILGSSAMLIKTDQRPKKPGLPPLKYKVEPAPDSHRCGVCPTYFQKICAFDFATNSTYIFDNHCIMDMYNCLNDYEFTTMPYDNCLYFGNFAYVHGYKYEDADYGEDHIIIKSSKKNPDFV